MTWKDNLFAIFVYMPIAVLTFAISEFITWPLKKMKIMKWDYFDYLEYMSNKNSLDEMSLDWKQESFYKIRYYDCGINNLSYLLDLIPMFSTVKVYLTIDEKPVITYFSKPIITEGTIKTTAWNWYINKEKIIYKLKQKRNKIMKQKLLEDF